jgi:hypothetical protein
MRQEYRNANGVLIGTTQQNGSKIEGRDRNGRLVGNYDPSSNVTRDWRGVKVGDHNLLPSLFNIFGSGQ